MHYEHVISQALADNFKDIPLNQCIPNASLIEISFTLNRNLGVYDEDFHDIIAMLSESCRALSIASMGKWDFFHPCLVYKPSYSGKAGVVSAKFFGKMKEKEVTKPSDTETDP